MFGVFCIVTKPDGCGMCGPFASRQFGFCGWVGSGVGKHPGGGDALETFSILGVVAGATEKLRLVTSVLVLPYRNPVLTAKMVASLDVLSGGRITLGVGVGWLKEEFEALNSPDFDRRGAVTIRGRPACAKTRSTTL